MKKKFIAASICATMAASACLALTACGDGASNTSALSANDAYGIGAVSTARLLGSSTPSAAVRTFSALNAATAAPTAEGSAESEVISQAEKFNEYFTALDSFLGDDLVTTVTAKNTDEKYAFDTVMTITGRDIAGAKKEYVMYYTETLVKSETDEEDGESENEYRLNGVMVIDGTDYVVAGERSDENEADESESELKIRAYADASDQSTYIEMSQEHSVENKEVETEYVYSVYVDGALVERTSVDFETENKTVKTETEYELEFINGTGKGKYKLEREVKNGSTKIKVKYAINGKSGVFHISETVDEGGQKHYKYSYSDGSVKLF